MKYLIDILENKNFDRLSIDKLKNFISRDGFNIVLKKDFVEMGDVLREFPVYENIIPIMTDNNSNYIGLYIDGILKGKICYLSHEENSLEPKFKSIVNLINAIIANPKCWELDELPETAFDYPNVYHSDLDNDKIIERLIDEYNSVFDNDIRIERAFCIMALTPVDKLETIYHFLDNDDMYIQERAIEIFGFHRCKFAREKIKELQNTAKHNGKTAAVIASKRIRESYK
jgi:hypothetical protein